MEKVPRLLRIPLIAYVPYGWALDQYSRLLELQNAKIFLYKMSLLYEAGVLNLWSARWFASKA